jgi:hypothetical protein
VALVALQIRLDVPGGRAKDVFIILDGGILAVVPARHGVRATANHARVAIVGDGAKGIDFPVGVGNFTSAHGDMMTMQLFLLYFCCCSVE